MISPLYLASNSPRRRHLLALTGLEFICCPADIDETPREGESPKEYVLRLARGKAAAAALGGPPGLYLGADTTVADGEEIMGKPTGQTDAARMLLQLRGREHLVYTAIQLQDSRSGFTHEEVCISRVRMRAYSQAEIDDYVRSGDPLDKAGAYAIQSPGFNPVTGFGGCYASVMGLPLCHIERGLRRLAGRSPADVPTACQTYLAYTCPVHAAILRGETAG
jgi:MAF protein